MVRFLRTIVALLAFLAVRPVIAAPPVIDQVVLVAQAVAEHAPEAEGDPADDRVAPTAAVHAAEKRTSDRAPALASFILVPHKYLRNCSLLR